MGRTKAILILLLAIALISNPIRAEDYNSMDTLTIESLIQMPIHFITTVSSPSLTYLHINYTWMPREDYRQQVLTLTTNPEAKSITDTQALFEIRTLQDITASVKFKTKTTSERIHVTGKIKFPIENLDQSLLQYTKATSLIDITPEIKEQAASIIKGDDDLYSVVFKLGDWVNSNIHYNLSTLTAEANLKSSWVLKNREGVCDELSNLYISMLRSIGIPARFVTGISYTESPLFKENWGGHGWVEVYFPRYGWIPFDPTYDQLGFVDATHIKLDEGVQGNKYNTEYEWKGRGVDVQTQPIDIKSYVVEKGQKRSDNIDIDVSFMRPAISIGSYDVVIARVTNNNDYYTALPLDIANTKEMEILRERKIDVLLKPHETKRVYWLIKVDDSLRQGYIYTFPVSVYTQLDEEHASEFKVSKEGEQVTREMAEAFIGKEQTFDSGITMTCEPLNDTVYIANGAAITCTIDNTQSLGTIQLCWPYSKCEAVTLQAGVSNISRNISFNETGYKTLLIEAKTPKGTEAAFLRVNVIDPTRIEIIDLNYDEEIPFDGISPVRFSLQRMSKSIPLNVEVTLKHDVFMKEWKMQTLQGRQDLSFDVEGKLFTSNANDLKLKVTYYDDAGKMYSMEKDFQMRIKSPNIWQQLLLWFNSANVWLTKLFGG